MSSNKLSFSIALNLLTENFKKGTNSVKQGFMKMQAQVLTFAAALGFGGLGLSNFISKLIEVSKTSSRAITALKNVSESTAQYIQNQKYLLDLSKKYGLEINALTSNFARFTASASQAGMAIEEQRKIFDAVSRATTAFSLSASETNGVFLALSQMMSKGKISSEELRLQMGEKLPIALQAMAKAAGVSIAELDDMMRKGELISSEILPKFADALTQMTPKLDTDNLETSLNKLSNAFTKLADEAGVENKYKKIIDGITRLIESAGKNIKNILVGIVAIITFIITNSFTKIARGWNITSNSIVANTKAANAKLQAATARRVAAENAMEAARLDYSVALGKNRLKAAEKVNRMELLHAKAVNAEIKAQQAADKIAAASKMTVWRRSFNAVKVGAAKLGVALKTMWNTFAPAIIISAIVAIVGYFKNLHDEAKRIKNIFKDYKKEVESISHTPEINSLQSLYRIANDVNSSIEDRKRAYAEIAKQLDLIRGKNETEIKYQERINKSIKDRIRLLEESAKADFYASRKVESDHELKQFRKKLHLENASDEDFDFIMKNVAKFKDSNDRDSLIQALLKYDKQLGKGQYRSVDTQKVLVEASNYWQISDDASKNIDSAITASLQMKGEQNYTPNTISRTDSELEKQQSRYIQTLKELDIKLQYNLIKQSDYNKAVDEATQSAFIEAKSSTDKEVLNSRYLQMLENAINHPLYNAQQVELENLQDKYSSELKGITNQKKNSRITEEEYRKQVLELTNSTLDTLATMDEIGDAGNAFISTLQSQITTLQANTNLKQRDTTFDYKKSSRDIAAEELSIAKENYELLKEQARDNIGAFESELNSMLLNIESLEEALKIAEVLEDVETLKKELNNSLYSGVKDIASSADRMVGSWSRLSEVMSDVDASGWEQIVALWSTLTNTIDSLLSIISLIEQFTELTDKLALAKEAEAIVDGTTTAEKITNMTAEAAAQNTILATQTTAETAASSIKTTAASTEMAAKSAAAFAAIPFAGPELAAAQIAAFEAMIAAASIPKFATGGIIKGGPTSGDKILARVNAGEMILNQSQQENLFKAIQDGRLGSGGQNINIGVEKIRGSDIFLSLKNYLKSSGKRLY